MRLILGLALILGLVIGVIMIEKAITGKTGWSQSGDLTAGGSGREVTMQANFPAPDVYTVQFNILSSTGQIPNPEAVVTWKVEGNFVDRLISVANGMTISGVGQGCRIRVYDNSQAITGFDYTASIQVSRGSRPASTVPPTYAPIRAAGFPGRIVVPATSTASITIPQNKGINSVQITASGIGGLVLLTRVDVSAWQESSVGGGTKLKEWFPPETNWVAIAPSAETLVLNNRTAGNILFGVQFGVDG